MAQFTIVENAIVIKQKRDTIFLSKAEKEISKWDTTDLFCFNTSALGFIMINDFINGTGFAFQKNNQIVTCAHVIKPEPNSDVNSLYFKPINSNGIKYKLHLIYFDQEHDIAILVSDTHVCKTPFRAPKAKKNASYVSCSDFVVYGGYDASLSNENKKPFISLHGAYVKSVGTITTDDNYISSDYIEFHGYGVPGYSGSPVWNTHGEVIGILARAEYRRAIKSDYTFLINTVFSIKPVIRKKLKKYKKTEMSKLGISFLLFLCIGC